MQQHLHVFGMICIFLFYDSTPTTLLSVPTGPETLHKSLDLNNYTILDVILKVNECPINTNTLVDYVFDSKL